MESTSATAVVELEATPGEPTPEAGRSYREALACLSESNVRFCLLRDRWEALGEVRDLDVLVHPSDRRLAFAALGRAGFAFKRDRRLRGKWVFLRCDHGRFDVIDLHVALVQNGLEYMSVRGALARTIVAGPAPRLCPEDQFLHLLLHNLLGKPALQEKHLPELRALHAAGLDAGRLADQTRQFGLGGVVRRARADLQATLEDPKVWRRLRGAARRALLRRPDNLFGAWRYRHGDRIRLGRRPVVLALLGPDGSGKTSFADALEALLRDTPLRAGRVYMGSWGHDLLPMRNARRLIPPQVSYGRLLLKRCGLPVWIAAEDRAILAEAMPSRRHLARAALRYGVKNAAFHLALAIEMSYRYLRHIAISRRPIVITDRYVYDLEFRQGKRPFVHGSRSRAVWYRLFPAPDGILYLTTPYDLVAERKPQLDREQFETMDRIFRHVLHPFHPLLLVSDAPAETMARAFLTLHWETLLERCNRRA
jgi:hypothetical protein